MIDNMRARDMMTWSRSVVDVLTELYPECEFEVILTLRPNPREYKGMDGAKIDVWQNHNRKFPTNGRIGKHLGKWHAQVDDCIREVNGYIEYLQGLHKKPEIIERNGKKYMLLEVDDDEKISS